MAAPAPILGTTRAPQVQTLHCTDPRSTSQEPSKLVAVGNLSLKILPQEMLCKPKIQLHARAVLWGFSVDELERVHPAMSREPPPWVAPPGEYN